MIKIHREGRLIVGITVVLLLIIAGLSARFLPFQVNYITALFSLVILVLIMRFFRIPRRHPLLDEKIIVAPADGKIVAIEKVQQVEFLNAPCIQVSIFMSFHDVHINYFPVSGKVQYLRYHPGRYLLARNPKSSVLNERCSVGIEASGGSMLVRQVAGTVARRIRCYAHEDDLVIQGNELGFIKFGSRLDLFLPLDTDIRVAMNQRVTGSITPVARFK